MLCSLTLIACTGEIRVPAGKPSVEPKDPTRPGVVAGEPVVERTTTRRLSRTELRNTLRAVFGADVPVAVDQLPDDTLTPFDNDVQEQAPSMRLVEATEAIGIEISEWVVAQPSRLAAIVSCTPDAACFNTVTRRLGKLLLRRPLDTSEVDGLQTLLGHPTANGTFNGAVKMLIRTLVLHPEFLYRVERGVAGDAQALRPVEVATRLSLLLAGQSPDEALLDAAEAGTLATAEGRRAQAQRLMASAAGLAQQRRFTAMWLGYSKMSLGNLETQMRAESDALVDRAFAPVADYRTLFSSSDTFVGSELAAHYGLTGATSTTAAWLPYGTADRRGILSHGTFAIAGAKFGDTSPTRRGKFIRERLLCQKIALPTANVDVDAPPKTNDPNACKIDRYAAHRADPTCASCHAQMDPLGFGLENLDHLGRYRTHDEGRPECVIAGKGAIDPSAPFTGPKGLADRIAVDARVDRCLASHLVRFAAGRTAQTGDDDAVKWLAAQLGEGHSMQALLLAYVMHENFMLRREDP